MTTTTTPARPRQFDDRTLEVARISGVAPNDVEKFEARMAEAKREHKKARRRLLELVVWDDPEHPMGCVPGRGYAATDAEQFDVELRARAHAVAVAFDRYTEYTCRIDGDIPAL